MQSLEGCIINASGGLQPSVYTGLNAFAEILVTELKEDRIRVLTGPSNVGFVQQIGSILPTFCV